MQDKSKYSITDATSLRKSLAAIYTNSYYSYAIFLILGNSIILKHSNPFQILGQSISKYDLALSDAEGLGDTGNEFPFGPDSLQVHDCGTHVRGDGAFYPLGQESVLTSWGTISINCGI